MSWDNKHSQETGSKYFLTEAELALRWRHSVRSLQRWRAAGKGPRAIRIGRRVVYRLSVVEAFEAAREADLDE